MISSSFPGSVDSPTSSRAKHGPVSTPAPRTFTPFGRYSEVGANKIKGSHPDVRLHVGSASTLYLSRGTLLGKDITYISQVWNAWDAESTQMFYEQVLPYIDPETLRPLMGICTPTVIGIHTSATDPYISAELKEKIITAYKSIHVRNILHNDVKLENILIGDDNEVTIVDFCNMAVNPEPADLALEMRAIKFMLDYDGAKEAEYRRLRRAESQTGKNFQRSWLRRTAESLGFGHETDHDDQPSEDGIDSLPFTRKCLMKWDSEVVTEGTTHCPGWTGQRIEVPEDMRTPPWPGVEGRAPFSTPPRQPIDSDPVKTTLAPSPFSSHGQRTKPSHYSPCLWSPVIESVASGLKKPTGTYSSPASPIDFSDYATGSERSSTSGSEPSEGGHPATPPFAGERLIAGDLTRPNDHSRGNKRTRRSNSFESFVHYQGDQASWITHRIERPGPQDLSPLSDLAPSPGKSSTGSTRSSIDSSRSRASTFTDPFSTRRKPANALPRPSCLRPTSERTCSIVVMDGDEEETVWFMSKGALRDLKGYLQVKKARGVAIEMPSGWKEDDVGRSDPRVGRALRSPFARLTRKRVGTPEDNDEEAQKPKRRRSWPEIDPCASKPNRGPLLRSC